jgi:hypothetical protein
MKHSSHCALGSPRSPHVVRDTGTFLIVVGMMAVMVAAIIINAFDAFASLR